ncbi:hypothetical protein AS850_04315 [Frondihabitans sp. 762G35]|uniref:PH domain-containing protein n=1 Tax=Frondihabitans sp. 762G35 TaxID=1446794 RepID=UPI000D1FE199|nr:PH domain-containing protein [Frondihabitans sp. 762G35]ARC56299.1 hypothetical protein AS850_04315 [Frondihabitans sp. 762G35]
MPDSLASTHRVSFVSRFNRILAVLIWALVVFMVVATIVGAPGSLLSALLAGATIALLDWIALWRPRVDVVDEGVVLQNLVRRITVPWEALIHVDTKYALTLHTPGRKYAAWAAPAPGRTGAAVAKRQARTDVAPRSAVGGTAAPGDLLTTESGAAAELVRERWEHLRESGGLELGRADEVRARVEWLWQPAALLVVLAAATVVALNVG